MDVCVRVGTYQSCSHGGVGENAGETVGLFLRLRASGRGGFHLLLMVQPRTMRTRQRLALSRAVCQLPWGMANTNPTEE